MDQSVNKSQTVILVSDHMLQIFFLVNYAAIAGLISSFGIIFNIINILVFIQLGFKETINISLLSLAVSDLGSILPLLWMSLCFNPLLTNKYRDIDFQTIRYVTAGWPHICFSRITGWLTACITFERYLCVAFPLTIKRIITSRRTYVIVIIIFVIFLTSAIPEYFGIYIGVHYNNVINRSVISLIYNDNGYTIENALVQFSYFSEVTSLIFVILSTIGLVLKFQQKSKWRTIISNSSQKEHLSARDRRTVQMIVWLSVIFIISYLPVSVTQLGIIIFKGYNIRGEYKNFLLVTFTFFFCLESANASISIFIYYNMSSRYRSELLNMLKRNRVKIQKKSN